MPLYICLWFLLLLFFFFIPHLISSATGLKRAAHCSLKIQQAKNGQLECGPMPNLMVALPNIGGALCSMPQSVPDAHY